LAEFYGEMQRALALYTCIWRNIVLLDASGQQLLNLLVPFGSPLPRPRTPELFERIMQSREPAISNLFPGSVTGELLLAVGVPVLRDGQVKYLVVAGFSPERLSALLLQQQLPPGWIATIGAHPLIL
jgi:hypothetical protein